MYFPTNDSAIQLSGAAEAPTSNHDRESRGLLLAPVGRYSQNICAVRPGRSRVSRIPFLASRHIVNLDIHANKVENIAMELFGAHTDTEGGFRYMVLGVDIVLISPGAEPRAVIQLLGFEASRTIERSTMGSSRTCGWNRTRC